MYPVSLLFSHTCTRKKKAEKIGMCKQGNCLLLLSVKGTVRCNHLVSHLRFYTRASLIGSVTSSMEMCVRTV